MSSYSAAGEDTWVVEQMKGKRNGTFLDIGCADPIEGNNTWLLERSYDWRGISLDRDERLSILWTRGGRRTPFICSDIHFLDLNAFASLISPQFDYLSLDVDEYQLEFVERFPWSKVRFNCMTVEHDSYRFGEVPRDKMRKILTDAGYTLAVKDVVCCLGAFEDWWIL